jgi:signal transduction histidine kinase
VTPSRRTTIAAVALAVAVLIPTTAWYVTGAGAARQRAAELETNAVAGLQAELHRDADRLAVRLEGLRASESERPFFHYQSLTHDPSGAAEGLAVVPSPLARGVSDPLVWAHFQLDETGLVSLPTVNERFPELSSGESFERFCSLLADLQNAMVMDLDNVASADPPDGAREVVLRRWEWEQIRDADSVYAAITGRGVESPDRPRPSSGDVVIRVGPLKWYTMVFGSGPTLAALRDVETPLGVRLQGFAVAPSGVEQWLGAGAETDVAFAPIAPLPENHLPSVVADTGWQLSADAGPLIEAARAEGRAAISQFRRAFTVGVTAILLAALAVMVVVIETERLARQRGRFAAAAAHELKTPLASLQLHSEMLAEGLGDPDQKGVYATRVAAESGRLGRVVSNMLDLARLERGARIATPRPGEVGPAVERCLERLRPSLSDAGLEIHADVADSLPIVSFDEDALCQILDNLLDNAEKYTRSQAERRAEVRVQPTGDGVEILVSDTGPGIPSPARRSLFRAFRRPKDENAPAGLGLGLALARSLARAQGGELAVADSHTAGAGFVLTLPTATSSEF